MQTSGNLDEAYLEFRNASGEQKLSPLKSLGLRYFTPREISRLMGFPDEFSFPEETTRIQRYRVLGNSLNVTVVAFLIKIMLQ